MLVFSFRFCRGILFGLVCRVVLCCLLRGSFVIRIIVLFIWFLWYLWDNNCSWKKNTPQLFVSSSKLLWVASYKLPTTSQSISVTHSMESMSILIFVSLLLINTLIRNKDEQLSHNRMTPYTYHSASSLNINYQRQKYFRELTTLSKTKQNPSVIFWR